jgi:hypothetical protein
MTSDTSQIHKCTDFHISGRLKQERWNSQIARI